MDWSTSTALNRLDDVGHAEPTGGATVERAATFGYVRGSVVGDLEITVEDVRRGRTMTTVHARATQDARTWAPADDRYEAGDRTETRVSSPRPSPR